MSELTDKLTAAMADLKAKATARKAAHAAHDAADQDFLKAESAFKDAFDFVSQEASDVALDSAKPADPTPVQAGGVPLPQ